VRHGRCTTSVSTIKPGIHGADYFAQSQLLSLGRAVENVRGYVEDFCNSLASETVDLILFSSHEAGVTRKSDRHEQRWGRTFESPGRQKAAGNKTSLYAYHSINMLPLSRYFFSKYYLVTKDDIQKDRPDSHRQMYVLLRA
jgi:hypothetical protein